MLPSDFTQTALKPHFCFSYCFNQSAFLHRNTACISPKRYSSALSIKKDSIFCEYKAVGMKHWCLWQRQSCETAVPPTEHFYFAMLTFPTEICFAGEKNANSYIQKSTDKAWQTTDILNTSAIPRPCQQLAALCPNWTHSFMPELEECNLSSAFRVT